MPSWHAVYLCFWSRMCSLVVVALGMILVGLTLVENLCAYYLTHACDDWMPFKGMVGAWQGCDPFCKVVTQVYPAATTSCCSV
jgi:hypothetical protein